MHTFLGKITRHSVRTYAAQTVKIHFIIKASSSFTENRTELMKFKLIFFGCIIQYAVFIHLLPAQPRSFIVSCSSIYYFIMSLETWKFINFFLAPCLLSDDRFSNRMSIIIRCIGVHKHVSYAYTVFKLNLKYCTTISAVIGR